MTTISKVRGGALAFALAGALLIQGCSSADSTITAQGTRILGSSGVTSGTVYTGPYSGPDWYAAQEAAMTDNLGE